MYNFKLLKSFSKTYGGLPKSIYILFISKIVTRIGSFVFAFMALYLKIKLGMEENEIATFIMLNGVFSVISPFIFGTLADMKGRKKIFIGIQILGASIYIICGILTDIKPEIIPYLLIAASMMYRGANPISNSMVADLTYNEVDRRRGYSLQYMGSNIGIAVGPMIGGFLLTNYVNWFFFGNAITTFLSVILVGMLVEETLIKEKEMGKIEGKEKVNPEKSIKVFLGEPLLIMFTFFSIIIWAVYSQMSFGLSLHMEHVFGGDSGAKMYGMLLSFNATIVILFTIIVTEFIKRYRTINSIAFASILYALGFGMTAFIGEIFFLYFLSVFIWTIGEIVIMTNTNVFIMAHTPVNHRGRFNAIVGLLSGMGFIISPKIMSFLIENKGYFASWKYVGLTALISTFGFFIISLLEKNQENTEKY